MTQFDILITHYADETSILPALIDYLAENSYTLMDELPDTDDTFWAWIPIITRDDMTALIENHLSFLTEREIMVIPILLSDVVCPAGLSSYFSVEVSEDAGELSPYFQEVLDYLSKGQRIVDKLAHIQQELASLAKHAETPQMPAYIDDLKHIRDEARRGLREPRVIHEANQLAILEGIQTLLARPTVTNARSDREARIIGNPPQGRSEGFKGRETEVASISNYLLDQHNDTRVISILGQGGVGKTALACHVLDMLSGHPDIDVVIYLSAESRTEQFSLERLFMMTGEAFGDDVREMLDRVWNNEKMSLDARIDYLIDQYVESRCLILLDNLEDVLTESGEFDDERFTQFFKQFVVRDHRASIVLTSRIPLAVDDHDRLHIRTVPLSSGLSEAYALELLQEFDGDGRVGFRHYDDVTLSKIIKITQGYPRALEAVTGMLVNDPYLTIDELLLLDVITDDEGLVACWVDHAESRLDADQRMVMQALSIFARPVDVTAVRFLLDPYVLMTAIDVPFTIERLERGRYITVNRMTGDISIHPLDKAYNYQLIQEGDTSIGQMSAGERFLRQMNILPPVTEDADEALFTRLTLEKRAGDFYAQLRGQPSDWQTIHDLQPYFLEYEHRLRAKDYETSFTMLLTIYNLLKLSGFSRKILEMITPLIEHLSDVYLMTCYNMLGMVYDDLGRYKDALNCHIKALPLARQQENQPAEAAHLSGIGLQYSNLGEYDRALEHYERALVIARETGKQKQERGILNNMAVVYNSIGRKLEGLNFYEQSLKIAREIDDKQGVAVTLANIGDSYGALGDIEKTVECYQESIEIYNAIGDKLGRGVTIGKMGNAAIVLGSYDDALKLLNVALGIAQAVGNQMWEVLHQADIAAVYVHQGELQKSLNLLEKIIPHAKLVGSPILVNYTHSLLAGVLLYDNQLERACNMSEIAITYVNPANRHYEYAMYGVILARLKRHVEAKDAFNTALDHAAELLENTPNLYSPKYSRGLALMGLALVTDDLSYAEDAKVAYIEARKNCDAKGIINREMKKLKLLTGTLDDDDDVHVWTDD